MTNLGPFDKVSADSETDGENTVYLDWCITYAYICVNVNLNYILTSKSPIRRECL